MTDLKDSTKWKSIEGFECYDVSNDGRVRSWKKRGCKSGRASFSRELKLVTQKDYHVVCLTDCRGFKKSKKVHRLVLTAFIGPCPDGMECCHGDGNGVNNHVNNLRWGTKIENHADRIIHETTFRGDQSAVAKLTWAAVRIIRASNESQKILATRFNVSQTQISSVRLYKNWKYDPEATDYWIS